MSNGNKYSQATAKTVAVAQVIRESKVKLGSKTSWTDPSWTIRHDAPEALRDWK